MRWLAAFFLSIVPIQGAAALEISPENPTACDHLTLVIQRSFTADCLWGATPRVSLNSGIIDVTLDLQGSDVCDLVLTDKTFELAIGSFPAGNYEVVVSWSDIDVVETVPVTIAPATCPP